jgi:hypothetical protein
MTGPYLQNQGLLRYGDGYRLPSYGTIRYYGPILITLIVLINVLSLSLTVRRLAIWLAGEAESIESFVSLECPSAALRTCHSDCSRVSMCFLLLGTVAQKKNNKKTMKRHKLDTITNRLICFACQTSSIQFRMLCSFGFKGFSQLDSAWSSTRRKV